MKKKPTDKASSPDTRMAAIREQRRDGLEQLKSRLTDMGHTPAWLADQLQLRRQTVSDWTMVPDHHLPAVCRLTGLTPTDLRPDLSTLFVKPGKRAA
jgi:hypothetical protein